MADPFASGMDIPLTLLGAPNAVPLLNPAGQLVLTTPPVVNNANALPNQTPLKLLDFQNSDGTVLTASAAAGKFGVANTDGTSLTLVSEGANNNTKTDIIIQEYVLGSTYTNGKNLTAIVNALYTLNGGTVSTHTIGCAAYLLSNSGTEGTTLETGAAQTVALTAADYSFTITGATLAAGSRIVLVFTAIVTETAAGGGVTITINSVRLQ